MMLKLVIFFAILSTVCCEKLSEEFDAERAEMCGQPHKPEKPSPNAADNKAPWIMGINYWQKNKTSGDMTKYYGSGVLVSPRHVIAPAYMGLEEVNNTNNKQWKWADKSNVDFKQCQENEMEIPVKTLKTLKVSVSTCQDPEQCGTRITRSVVKGWYLGNCQSGEVPFGLLLLEISSNVPQDGPYFVPVCLPAEEKPAFVKDTVQFDSMKGDKKVSIISEPATIQSCNANIGKFVQSVCAVRTTCAPERGGRSGTLVKKINGRDTGIAVLFEWFAKDCNSDHYVSIGFFKDKLCSLAGICKVTTQPVETSSQSSVQHILVFILLALFL